MHPKNVKKYQVLHDAGIVTSDDGVTWIPLTQGAWAKVDNVDAECVLKHCWHLQKTPTDTNNTMYAITNVVVNGRRTTVSLHRFVASLFGVPEEFEVDHRDGDGLNCRRGNLRSATRSQNQTNTDIRRRNRSGYRGVSWDEKSGKWRASIRLGKSVHLGFFDHPKDARDAYRLAESRFRDPDFIRSPL